MSRYMIIGGFAGFSIVFLAGLIKGRYLAEVLPDAMISCLIMGLLGRFLYQSMERGVVSVLEKEAEKQKAEAESELEPQKESDGKKLTVKKI